VGDVVVNEGAAGAQAVFTVTRPNPAPFPVTVDYSIVPGLAVRGADYDPGLFTGAR
jgi:hypothetical protein